MLRFFTPACAAIVLIVVGLAPPELAHAAAQCGDFLNTLAKKPPPLVFTGCAPATQGQLGALVATYRVSGERAAQTERYFVRHAKMPKLRFVCCGWEPGAQSGPRQSELRRGTLKYSVTMHSDETLISSRENWGRIPWFHISVTLLLDQP